MLTPLQEKVEWPVADVPGAQPRLRGESQDGPAGGSLLPPPLLLLLDCNKKEKFITAKGKNKSFTACDVTVKLC